MCSLPIAAQERGLLTTKAGASDGVFVGIMNGLLMQKLVPGQRLIEVDLAEQYGVSRNSVRQALNRLASEGVLDLVRHKGAVIRTLSEKETLDVLDVAERMMALLALSAARGIALGQSGQEMTDALSLLKTSHEEHDSTAFARARRLFYRALLEASANQELRRLFPAIHMPIVYAQYRPRALQELRLRDYGAIGQHVLQGNEKLADLAGAQHVQNVRAEILKMMG
jgi:DNA-binding GntR family transcriptional regulator